jgi:DNA-binding cell septation regulator SpoVG
MNVFALRMLLDSDIVALWFFSIAFLCFSVLVFFIKKVNFINVFHAILTILIIAELCFRLVIIKNCPETKNSLVDYISATYPELRMYKGHPFLQFTGNPNYHSNSNLNRNVMFNKFGFNVDWRKSRPEFGYEKPTHTIRIACLGGSTTADGWPWLMEDYLNKNNKDTTIKYQVLNFGMTSYTTAHSLVNFVLNVVNFSPDYVIIHHAWNDNDGRLRGALPGEFRSDYSHGLKSFESPFIIDLIPIRASIIYDLIKMNFNNKPDFAYLEEYNVIYDRKRTHYWYSDTTELKYYKSNIETITDIAMSKNMKVMLVTMPHTSNSRVRQFNTCIGINQANNVARKIKMKYGDKMLFVDMDSIMTGKMDTCFTDIAHMTENGIRFKAQNIGKVILNSRFLKRY